MNFRRHGALFVVAWVLGLAGCCLWKCPKPPAGGFDFVRIADTATLAPGSTEPFMAFSHPHPALSGEYVVFEGNAAHPDRAAGLYLHDGSRLQKLVDRATALPGRPDRMDHILWAALEGDRAVFRAFSNLPFEGLYAASPGGVELVADFHTKDPQHGEPFAGFGQATPRIDGGRILFTAMDAKGRNNVYIQEQGRLETHLAAGLAAPDGAGNFQAFNYATLDGPVTAFSGVTDQGVLGIYLVEGGTVRLVADNRMTAPGLANRFTRFGRLSLAGHDVAFKTEPLAGDGGALGIFGWVDGKLHKVASLDTTLEGLGGAVAGFRNPPSISGGRILFTAEGPGQASGLYLWEQGAPVKVLATGDALDGRTVAQVDVDAESLDGRAFAFKAVFTDRSEGIYRGRPR